MNNETKKPPPPEEPQRPMEDAGTQALSDALSSSFKVVKVIMIAMVLVFIASGVREIGSFERGVKLTFGKPSGTGEDRLLEPGWHWAWPYPINEIVPIEIGRVHEVRSGVGWYFNTPENEAAGIEPPVRQQTDPRFDSFLLTGDGNLMHGRATLRYQISDPVQYAFHHVAASNLVRNALNNALYFASVRYPVDDAVRRDVAGFRQTVLSHIRQEVLTQNLGITIEDSLDLAVIPPRQVKSAFEEVIGAENDRSRRINQAEATANRLIATAAGEAESIINAGRAEANRMLQNVNAQAQYFKDQLPYYRANPELYVSRVQAETLGRVMTNVYDKYFLSEPKSGQDRQLRIQINRPSDLPQNSGNRQNQ